MKVLATLFVIAVIAFAMRLNRRLDRKEDEKGLVQVRQNDLGRASDGKTKNR